MQLSSLRNNIHIVNFSTDVCTIGILMRGLMHNESMQQIQIKRNYINRHYTDKNIQKCSAHCHEV